MEGNDTLVKDKKKTEHYTPHRIGGGDDDDDNNGNGRHDETQLE